MCTRDEIIKDSIINLLVSTSRPEDLPDELHLKKEKYCSEQFHQSFCKTLLRLEDGLLLRKKII